MYRFVYFFSRRMFTSFLPSAGIAATILFLLLLIITKTTRRRDLPQEYIDSVNNMKQQPQQPQLQQQRSYSIVQPKASTVISSKVTPSSPKKEEPKDKIVIKKQKGLTSSSPPPRSPPPPVVVVVERRTEMTKKPERKKSERKNKKIVCGMKKICGSGQVGYSITSGSGMKQFPHICVDDVVVISAAKKNYGRGINVVVFDTVKEKVTWTTTFDTYSESGTLTAYLQDTVQADKILLVTTFDDANNALKDGTKNWFKKFGSKKITEMKFRGSWAMIGQRGAQNTPEKIHNPAKTPDFGGAVYLEGCFDTPEIGPLSVVGIPDTADGFVEKGTKEKNCGLKSACSKGEFSLYLNTGKENKKYSKICYNGVYYMEKGVNDAGRGLNVIVIDGVTKNVTKRGTFDTYTEDSTTFEIFLGVVKEGDVVVMVTFDDATKNFGPLAKRLLAEIGSTKVDLFAAKFRTAYYLVARKGGGDDGKGDGGDGKGGGKGGGIIAEDVALPREKGFPPTLEYGACIKV